MKSISFDDTDNLCLKTFSFDKDTIRSENDIIRNLKDENGRLMKLLQEKDFEINKIKRVSDKQNIVRDNLSEGAASLKIIELSKKLRETNAECESWKTKYYQRDKEAKNVVNEARVKKMETTVNSVTDQNNEMKIVKEKLKTSENKVLELLTSNQSLSRELKTATKVLESELGDTNVDVARLLANPGQWRGRAQKIVSLRDKVDLLERQLKEGQRSSGRELGSGATSLGVLHDSGSSHSLQFHLGELFAHSPQTRQSDVLARIHRDKQLSANKLEEEHRRVCDEQERIKRVCDGLKARNKCLSDENKSCKDQIKNMLEKTRNDDELIGSLILEQDRLKSTLQSMLANQERRDASTVLDKTQSASQGRQDKDTVEKMREILALKDAEILRLRETSESVANVASLVSGPNVDYEQLKISSSAMATEIGQLRELVRTEEVRLESLLDTNMTLAEDNSRLKQSYLQLERELQKIAPNNKFKAKQKIIQSQEPMSESNLSVLLSQDVSVTRDTIESLQEEVCMRTDKIESLKNALELMSSAKKEDVKMLTDIIDQTRHQFVDSIKKLKSHCQNKDG